jgi:hypothetical protein
MLNRTFIPEKGSLNHGVIHLYGQIPLGTSGALAATYSAAVDSPGATVTKTATEAGRYTVTLQGPVKKLLHGVATVLGADDTAIGTGGSVPFLRDNDLASDGTIEIQFARSDTGADAEIADNLAFTYHLVLQVSSVVP